MSTKNHITAVDIAKHLGLAPTTVSHVLAGRAERVRIKSETQNRVLEAARSMGYRTNASARAMRTGHFGCAAFIQPLRHMYLAPALLVGLSRELEKRNMHLSLAHVSDDVFADEEYLPKIVRELAADGLVINAAFDFPQNFLDAIESHHIPTIWVNHQRAMDCVYPDDFTGGLMGTQHLLAMGHTNIVFAIANPLDTHYSVGARQGGYEEAMRSAGLQPHVVPLADVEAMLQGHRSDQRIARATQLLTAPDRPTAILAYERDTALPILFAAAGLGLEVPRDLSLAMFHSQIDSHSGYDITTLLAGWETIGRETVDALLQKINEPKQPMEPRPVTPTLFEGKTCAPPQR